MDNLGIVLFSLPSGLKGYRFVGQILPGGAVVAAVVVVTPTNYQADGTVMEENMFSSIHYLHSAEKAEWEALIWKAVRAYCHQLEGRGYALSGSPDLRAREKLAAVKAELQPAYWNTEAQ